jgi:N-acetylmuramoyl-L-alanine amidase
VDSTVVWGSVGTGGAWLWIDDALVPVAPNGAFIAYLPLPADGVWDFTAEKDGRRVTHQVAYAAPARATATDSARSASVPEGVLASPRAATVAGGTDTLATGSDAVFARPTPTGTYRWFFPRGARLAVAERRGGQYRVALDRATDAWIDTTAVRLGDTAAPPPGPVEVSPVTIGRAGSDWELRAPARHLPFLVETRDSTVTVTVYGGTGMEVRGTAPPDDFYRSSGMVDTTGTVHFLLAFSGPPWGYRAWYEPDGDLVVRIRRPPAIDPADPLRGRRIVVDPGHPPAGTTGPTGLYEGDANLAVALPLAEKLRARGAEVILTRTAREGMRSSTSSSVELRARAELAVSSGADLFVSLHNNAFGEGADPARAHGTMALYFHPLSADLAAALDREVVGVTGIPDLGARAQNVAVLRPTWLPAAMTESLFMPIPEQENALRDPAFIERLAEAHLRGIEAFLRRRAADYAGRP